MTLIEVIGVLAVIAILAAVVLPALIREIDKAVADQETANLQAFGNALQRNILRNGYIPGAADWLTNVATELGMAVSDVATNIRNRPRFFLIDPGLQVGTNYGSLPYLQKTAGSLPPAGVRVMVLSSLGVPFPAGMSSGIPTAGDFSNIWNTADGLVPSGVSALSGWGGTGADLKIQRVNLSQLFIHLILTSYASTNTAYYSINGTLNPSTLSSSNWLDRYFLQNSVLGLYSASTNAVDSQQILTSDSSFVYYQNGWRATLESSTGAASSTNLVGNFDFSAIVNGFLVAPASPGGPTQQTIVADFIAYLNAYTAWAGSNFSDSGLYNTAMSAFNQMQTDVNNLESSFP